MERFTALAFLAVLACDTGPPPAQEVIPLIRTSDVPGDPSQPVVVDSILVQPAPEAADPEAPRE